MFFDTATCTTCGQEKICVVLLTFKPDDPMRMPFTKVECVDCLYDSYQDVLEGIRQERKLKRIK